MSPFETAFASARKAGKKEFTFKGKRYNTKLKEEAKVAPRARPTASKVEGPKARPVAAPPAPKRKAAGTPDASGRKVMDVSKQKGVGARIKDRMSNIRAGNAASRKEREAARKARRGNK